MEKEIKDLVKQGNIKKALEKLNEFAANTGNEEVELKAIGWQSRYNTLENSKLAGSITRAEASVELNNITIAILSVIKELNNVKNTPSPTESKPISNKNGWTNSPDDVIVLFLASNPSDTAALQLDKEFGKLFQAVQNDEKIRIFKEERVSPTILQDVLLDKKPRILHFSGHGIAENDETEKTLIGKRSGIGDIDVETAKEGLMFVNENTNKAQLVTGEMLEGLFQIVKEENTFSLQLVILNACFSEAVAEDILKHVPYVIAMNKAVEDEMAIFFAQSLYKNLSKTKIDVEKSFKRAISELKMNGIIGADIPQLKKNVV
ncbi:MAG: hypothetical protein RL757_3253 [Bacteroidota bacterium]|jgi:hypothetical protein